uniref:DUF3707 domain-containing protein n=1 Tax=Panagrellus redivivus TaxID=6233 RepID=A0A7E4VX02_PANRE
MVFLRIWIGFGLFLTCVSQYVWPNHRIPYEVDEALYRDQNQLYALLNAKSDLETRTCVSFMPRINGEYSYVLFADLGPHQLCWDLFSKGSGVLPVNVGRSCLSPFGKSKGVSTFSDCDIAYINVLYKCPGAETWLDTERCPRHGFRKVVPSGTIWGRRPTPAPSVANRSPWPSRKTTTTHWPNPTKATSRKTNHRPSTRSSSSSIPSTRASTTFVPSTRHETYETKPSPTTTRLPESTTTRELRPKLPISKIDGVADGKSTTICGSMCHYDGILSLFHRSVNNDFGISNHFYTEDRAEQGEMTAEGYTMLEDLAYLGQTPADSRCKCLKPLYRLFSDGRKDTLLTIEEDERRRAVSQLGFKFERIIGYCTSDPGCGAFMPLYRFFNFFANDHLYTTDQSEALQFKSNPLLGYGLERIECYLWQHNVSTDACE